jgi:hypothetical protein
MAAPLHAAHGVAVGWGKHPALLLRGKHPPPFFVRHSHFERVFSSANERSNWQLPILASKWYNSIV